MRGVQYQQQDVIASNEQIDFVVNMLCIILIHFLVSPWFKVSISYWKMYCNLLQNSMLWTKLHHETGR